MEIITMEKLFLYIWTDTTKCIIAMWYKYGVLTKVYETIENVPVSEFVSHSQAKI